MRKRIREAGRALGAPAPTLVLGGGLAALAGMFFPVDGLIGRLMSCIAAVSLLALGWMLRKQSRALHEMRQQFAYCREELMTRRSTMRFVFDELLDDSGTLRDQVNRTRHRLLASLSVTSGYLELLSDELRLPHQAPADRYFREVRKLLAESSSLTAELGQKVAPVGSESGRAGRLDKEEDGFGTKPFIGGVGLVRSQ